MTTHALLVGPHGHGGEGIYVDTLERHPPGGVAYTRSGGFHRGAPGARCRVGTEVALNRLVHPLVIPDMGFRALSIDERFDLIHVHAHPISLRGARGTPLVMSEGSSSAVYLADYLGWDQERLARGYRRARRVYRALGIADRLLTLERAAAAYVFSTWAREVNLHWGADPEKLEVIAPGFPTPDPVDRRGREAFTFLFVGGDFERKGGFDLIEAFAGLAREHPAARLLLAGTDPTQRNPDRLVHSWVSAGRRERALATLAELERAGRAKRLPWLDRAKLVGSVYPRADAFVMPSHAEGFGFTNIEAMSFGLPVITSTAGPAGEIIEEGRTGQLVAPGDSEALRNALAQLAGDPDTARRIGEAARLEFLRRFTVERLRADLGALYRRALEA
ncbi:MAG: glycosyltransferase family 4 protein [Solirubrobacterales bacterium]